MKSKKDQTFLLRIERELLRRLKQVAKLRGVSVAALIRESARKEAA